MPISTCRVTHKGCDSKDDLKIVKRNNPKDESSYLPGKKNLKLNGLLMWLVERP